MQELLDNSPFIKKAMSLEELARAIGVDVPTFLGEVDALQRGVRRGARDASPRSASRWRDSKRFDTPPYYAIQLFPLARKNFGGVKTDIRCRALNAAFEPIPGLYAAGEVAGMAGGHIKGRPASRARCSAPRCSAAAWPAAGPRTRRASVRASSAAPTARAPRVIG